MRNRKAQGFTLIELLIVIAIIGILAAVLIPNLLSARATSVDRSAQAYGHNVLTAVTATMADNLQLDLSTISDNCAVVTPNEYLPVAGSAYPVPAPGFAWAAAAPCTVNVDAAGNVEVIMNYTGGTLNTRTVGNLVTAAVN